MRSSRSLVQRSLIMLHYPIQDIKQRLTQKSPLIILNLRHWNALVHIKSKRSKWFIFGIKKNVYLINETKHISRVKGLGKFHAFKNPYCVSHVNHKGFSSPPPAPPKTYKNLLYHYNSLTRLIKSNESLLHSKLLPSTKINVSKKLEYCDLY